MGRRQRFIETYTASWLAAWGIENYARLCSMGCQDELNHPPVEDAEFSAEKAWDEGVDILGWTDE